MHRKLAAEYSQKIIFAPSFTTLQWCASYIPLFFSYVCCRLGSDPMATSKNRGIFIPKIGFSGENLREKKFFSKKITTKILPYLQNLWMVSGRSCNANEKIFYDILGLKQGRALKIRTRPHSCGCFLCVKLISKENFFCDILCSKERAAENATDPKNKKFFRENTTFQHGSILPSRPCFFTSLL